MGLRAETGSLPVSLALQAGVLLWMPLVGLPVAFPSCFQSASYVRAEQSFPLGRGVSGRLGQAGKQLPAEQECRYNTIPHPSGLDATVLSSLLFLVDEPSAWATSLISLHILAR